MSSNILTKLGNITGFIKIKDDRTVVYCDLFNIENKDVTKVIRDINTLLKKEVGKNITSIDTVYHTYIKYVLDVGDIYSSYVEIVLCNMYLTEDREIMRYAINRDINLYNNISIKLTPKTLNTAISKLLGLLYEPNAGSICTFADASNPLAISSDTVFEKLWTGMF